MQLNSSMGPFGMTQTCATLRQRGVVRRSSSVRGGTWRAMLTRIMRARRETLSTSEAYHHIAGEKLQLVDRREQGVVSLGQLLLA